MTEKPEETKESIGKAEDISKNVYDITAMNEYERPIAVYVRVSTEKQELDNQLVLIESWLKAHGLQADYRFIEQPMSGGEDERPQFLALWEKIDKGEIKTLVVAELSRLSRRMPTLVNFLYKCVERDVTVVSLREEWLANALKNKMFRPIVIAMLSTLYELERQMISERTKAGLERAKREGKHVGRPPKLSVKEQKKIMELYSMGVPISRIASQLGVSRSTVKRYIIMSQKRGKQ
ncbi:MAG: recombinase family protein [Thermofilum sp.]|uniref:recombinase family protein n=1 Tax=Thermofilum sp. TaxID=1961369 RepID=UPI00317A8445